MYLKRDIEKYIKSASGEFQAIALYGARQTGKSTTLNVIFGDEFSFVSLDDSAQRELALNNPKKFLEFHKWPLIIDEVQKAPLLLDYIKIAIDKYRLECLKNDKPRRLMYVLAGSNQYELQQGIGESLAGRVAIFNLSSLTQIESQGMEGSCFNPRIDILLKKERESKLKYAPKTQIFSRIFRGGMPDIVVNNVNSNLYFKSYFDTYIEKDVLKLISASKEMQFRRFISYLALRTAQQVNWQAFSNDLGVDSATLKKWVSILITSGIVILLEPYMANISKRIIKSPKLYFMDTGLCAYLCKWPNAEMLENCAMSGAFFETFVVSEVIKSFINSNTRYDDRLFYYRDIDQKEIDLLYVENDSIYPIEIKKGDAPSKPTKNFNVLSKYNLDIKPGLVVDSCDKIFAINDKAYAFPVYLLGL